MSGVPRERAAISKLEGGDVEAADVEAFWAFADVAIAHKTSNAPAIRPLMPLSPKAPHRASGKRIRAAPGVKLTRRGMLVSP